MTKPTHVWVLTFEDEYEITTVLGVFTTLEQAKASARPDLQWRERESDEWFMDYPNDGLLRIERKIVDHKPPGLDQIPPPPKPVTYPVITTIPLDMDAWLTITVNEPE